ncbi:MAG: methyltransferase domain-containing protein [Dehalococcoidia bacterium]
MPARVGEQRSQPLPEDSDWLLPFLGDLRRLGRRVLEIGCGPGLDSATLTANGFEVVAFDRRPLAQAKNVAPEALFLRADLSRPFPFRDGMFDSAVASLSLHYDTWTTTRAAFREIRRVVKPGSAFLFRVNAFDDVFHGAGEGQELERGFFLTPNATYSETKRFFDEEMVAAAVEGLFTVASLRHMTIHRYENPKRVFECLARAI